jgi:hypothetical protein
MSWRSCYTKGFNGSIPKDNHIIVKVICGSIGFRPHDKFDGDPKPHYGNQ